MTLEKELIAKWTYLNDAFCHAFREHDNTDRSQYLPSIVRKYHIKDIDVQQLDTIRNIRNAIAHPGCAKDGSPLFELKESIISILDDAIKIVHTLPRVSNVQKVNVSTCCLDDEIESVISTMVNESFSNVPVVDKERHVIGVFSESILPRLGLDMLRKKHFKKIRDIMEYLKMRGNTRRLDVFHFVKESDPVALLNYLCHEAAKSKSKRAEAFFVTDNGKKNGVLTGIVTVWDFVGLIEQ